MRKLRLRYTDLAIEIKTLCKIKSVKITPVVIDHFRVAFNFKCKVFVMKISFHSYAIKTNFHMKSFAISHAFIVRFTAT